MHRLGRYHLSECLGGGPTGEVYRAKVYGIAGMERDFAVKRFHPTFVTGSAAAAEIAVAAQLYGSLDHPKVAKLQELGVSGDHTFTAVEFVPGVDLSQLIDQGQLPLGAAARLVVQICRAVGYVHSQGIKHLGLAPTNVICSERGEIKVTDVGFLPPRLPRRPAEDASLQLRLCYLAPEQLNEEAVSAATDVYQLGTIAFELMVGRKPYAGRTGLALANQMLAGNIPQSGLATPFQKVLKRALARSPFERFPDAGAMADAIEAALRTSPADGSLDDVGAAVSEREVYLASSRNSQASGALSFPIPAPPSAERAAALDLRTPPPIPGSTARSAAAHPKKGSVVLGASTTEHLLEDDAEIDFVNDTIDVELIGEGEGESERDTVPTMDAPLELSEAPRGDGSGLLLGPAGTDAAATGSQFIGGEDGARNFEKTLPGGPVAQTPAPVSAPASANDLAGEASQAAGDGDFQEVSAASAQEGARATLAEESARRLGAVTERDSAPKFPPPLQDVNVTPPPMDGAQSKSGLPSIVKYAAMAALVGGFAFLTFSLLASDDEADQGQGGTTGVAVITAQDAGSVTGKSDTKQVAQIDRGAADASSDPTRPAREGRDAALLEAAGDPPADAAAAVALVVPDTDAALAEGVDPVLVATPSATGGLQVGSQPAGAKVYLDGSLVGNTPVRLDSSADDHRLALVLPGYALYTGEIQGKGLFNIDLKEVTPPEGPGGIKVRCKETNRYYVFVDDKAVGQLCPTERIGVSKGKHVVEIYDPVTDARREFTVEVVDTRLSIRVRVD